MRIKGEKVWMKSWRIFEERESKKLGGSQWEGTTETYRDIISVVFLH